MNRPRLTETINMTQEQGNEPPECGHCGEEMVLLEEETMMGDKYGCQNESCPYYTGDEA